MPTVAGLQDLERVQMNIKQVARLHGEFYFKLANILDHARATGLKFRVACKMIIDEEYREKKPSSLTESIMPDVTKFLREKSESDRQDIYRLIIQLREKYFEEFNEFADFLRDNRWTGYDNICRLMLGETPTQVYTQGRYITR